MHKDADLVELVQRVYLFSDLPTKAVKRVVNACKLIDHAEGRVILREGESAYGMHIIVDGTAEVSVRGTPLAVLGRGNYFGELALIDGRERTATVTAASPLQTLSLARPAFRSFVQGEPTVAMRLMVGLAGRLREAQEALAVAG